MLKAPVPRSFYEKIYTKFAFTFLPYRFKTLSKIINDNDFVSYVEVGVWDAQNLCEVMNRCPKLVSAWGIDPYSHKEYFNVVDGISNVSQISFDLLYEAVVFACEDDKRVKILRLPSKDAVKQFRDDSVDIVFIDALHDYEYVKHDIDLWWPKVRKGGYLTGHDYANYPGVGLAVRERFKSFELFGDNVWAVKK